jgi:hypothetical protein
MVLGRKHLDGNSGRWILSGRWEVLVGWPVIESVLNGKLIVVDGEPQNGQKMSGDLWKYS